MEAIETIHTKESKLLALILRAEFEPAATRFVTPDDANMQLGFVVYPAGSVIQRHQHLPLQRSLVGTPEVLIVRHGRCEVDIYDAERQLVATRSLDQGDVLVMLDGGHGFRLLEDTVFLEVKLGPYKEIEKEHF